MKNYFFLLLIAFFLQFCVHSKNERSKNCDECFNGKTKKAYIQDFVLEVPILYNVVKDKHLQDSFTGKILCSACENAYISFDCGQWEWDNFPDSEESYIQSEKWYEHKPLEKTKFTVLKTNDSIRKIYPSSDYYAIDSVSGNTYPIQIPDEVKNYQFIYHNDSSFKLKIAYSIAREEGKKYHVWLEAMPSNNHETLSLHYVCRTIRERDSVIKMYKTIKMKE